MKSVFTGVATALITPINEDLSINYKAFASLVESQIKNGIDALLVGGTTGEGSVLSYEEFAGLTAVAVEVSGGRVPVIANASSNITEYAEKLARIARKCRADALLSITPYYNKTTPKGLAAHIRVVSEAAELPTIVYNVPSRTGMTISSDTYSMLANLEWVEGVKEASTDMAAVVKNFCETDGRLNIYCGNDNLALPFFSLGSRGIFSVISNYLPRKVVQLYRAFASGYLKESNIIMREIHYFYDKTFFTVNPIPVKYIMNEMGIFAGVCRPPLCGPDDSDMEQLKEAAQKAKELIH